MTYLNINTTQIKQDGFYQVYFPKHHTVYIIECENFHIYEHHWECSGQGTTGKASQGFKYVLHDERKLLHRDNLSRASSHRPSIYKLNEEEALLFISGLF